MNDFAICQYFIKRRELDVKFPQKFQSGGVVLGIIQSRKMNQDKIFILKF